MRRTHAIHRDLEHLAQVFAEMRRIERPRAGAFTTAEKMVAAKSALLELRRELHAELGEVVAFEAQAEAQVDTDDARAEAS